MEEFTIGNKSKLRVAFIKENKTAKGGTFYSGQASISAKKNSELDWGKDNTIYVNFNFTSWDSKTPLKDGDKIELEDFYFQTKYYTNKDGKKVLGKNIIANKVNLLDADGKENKPSKVEKIEISDDELPF